MPFHLYRFGEQLSKFLLSGWNQAQACPETPLAEEESFLTEIKNAARTACIHKRSQVTDWLSEKEATHVDVAINAKTKSGIFNQMLLFGASSVVAGIGAFATDKPTEIIAGLVITGLIICAIALTRRAHFDEREATNSEKAKRSAAAKNEINAYDDAPDAHCQKCEKSFVY